ncbi:MAG TPA: GumC family protein [Pirellulales bacterium]|nr:GumC family protein [Pirellulales bacterium]
MHTRKAKRSTARDLVRVLFRHKRQMLWFFATTMGLVIVGLIVMPRTYMSEARLFVRMGKESVGLDPTAAMGQTVPVEPSRENEINSELDILRSRVLMQDVVEKLGSDVILRSTADGKRTWAQTLLLPISTVISFATESGEGSPEERAIRKLEKSITCSTARKSNVIVVKCKARDPRLAQTIADTFVNSYLLRHAKANRTSGSHDFFVQQSTILQDQLDKANEELRAAKNKVGLLSIDGQRENIQQQINTLESRMLENNRNRAASHAKIKALNETLAKIPAQLTAEEVSGLPNVAGDSMRNELYKLQMEENSAASRHTDEHPGLKAIRRQVDEMKTILAEQEARRSQTTKKLNPVYQDAQKDLLLTEAQLASEDAEAKSLETQMADIRTRLTEMNDTQERVNELVRKTELIEASYRQYAQNREQARIDEALESDRISNVNVVQPPSFVAKPVSPKKGLTLACGLILATLGSLTLAFASEHFDRSVKTAEEVERELGVPVLLSVPRHLRNEFQLN